MDKVILYKNDDGDILQAVDFEPVERDEIVRELEEARAAVRKLQATLDKYDSLDNAAPGTDTEAEGRLKGVDDGDGHIRFIKVTADDGTETPQI